MNRIFSLLAVAFLATAMASARAAVIFDTYNGDSSGTVSQIHSGSGKGISFAMPNPLQPTGTTSYSLDDIQLLLSATGGAVTTGALHLSLYSNSGSNTPGTLLTTLSMTATSLTSTPTFYTFTADTPTTLQAGTTYWVTLYGANGTSNQIGWGTSSSLPSPPSTVGVTLVGRIISGGGNANNPPAWTNTSTSVTNAFIVDATAVPEPATWALLAVSGVMVVVRRRMRA